MNRAPQVDLIAEVAQAHDGSLGAAHAYVDAVAASGVGTIKFQVHVAEAESSEFEPFRVPFSRVDATRFDYWKRTSFTEEQWLGIRQHCDEAGIEFLASPFSIAAVELLERVEVARYKIGSGEVGNLLMLDRIAATGKPIILSSGLSSFEDLDLTIGHLRRQGAMLSLLQCTTSYPTRPEDVNLPAIPALRARYGLPVGLSDHSGKIWSGIAAVAMGAELLEFHVVFDRRAFGPDSTSSLEIRELPMLVEGVGFVMSAMSPKVERKDLAADPALKKMFGKSLAVNADLPAGHAVVAADLESKKPGGHGIPASDYARVLGKVLKRPLRRWDFLDWSDLND